MCLHCVKSRNYQSFYTGDNWIIHQQGIFCVPMQHKLQLGSLVCIVCSHLGKRTQSMSLRTRTHTHTPHTHTHTHTWVSPRGLKSPGMVVTSGAETGWLGTEAVARKLTFYCILCCTFWILHHASHTNRISYSKTSKVRSWWLTPVILAT
jgi:hypothetical protein